MMTTPPYDQWADNPIDRDDARRIVEGDGIDLLPLLEAARAHRQRHFDNTVTVHVLDNVQNGACPEDCNYCGQSKVSDAPVAPYKLKPVDAIVADAKKAKDSGAYRFCMVLSGRGPDGRDIAHMTDAIRQVKAMGLRTCLSAGLMGEDEVAALKSAGLDRLNHNLNTSRDHYGEICTTHTYQDRLDTLQHAKTAGLGVCSGLIAGMNETYDDLVDVAFALREIHAESIPVNFLLPIEGNPLKQARCEGAPLSPQLCLRVLCMMRLVNVDAEIRVAAGREYHLRTMQAFSLWPANSLFVDGYLLSEGSGPDTTLRMIRDAGFTVATDDLRIAERLESLGEPEQTEFVTLKTSASRA